MDPVESVEILRNGDSLSSERLLMLRPVEEITGGVTWSVKVLHLLPASDSDLGLTKRLMRSRQNGCHVSDKKARPFSVMNHKAINHQSSASRNWSVSVQEAGKF